MAMSRLKKNVVAAALAGSMVIALPGAAFATTVGDNGFTVDKTWTAASNTQLNNAETFTFQIQFTGADEVGTWEPTSLSADAKTRTLTAKWQDLANPEKIKYNKTTCILRIVQGHEEDRV